MSKARKTPTRPHPWTPLETSALCPPGKRWKQRSRQLSTKVLPVPSSPGSEAEGQRRAQTGARSHPRRCFPTGASHLHGGRDRASLRSRLPCVPFYGTHWLLCLPAVGIVPPRTKSPTDEEVTPSRVVKRSASGLTNGLSSRVSARPQAPRARAGLSWAGSPGASVCPPICHCSRNPGLEEEGRTRRKKASGGVLLQGDVTGQGSYT